MRGAFLPFVLACVLAFPVAAPAADRHGVAADPKGYPQATPKEALASVLKAVADKRFDYLAAHLAEPEFVDSRVKAVFAGKFADLVKDVQARLDPSAVKLLARFLKEGEWEVAPSSAVVTLKEGTDRVVRFQQKGGVWYLEHASGKR